MEAILLLVDVQEPLGQIAEWLLLFREEGCCKSLLAVADGNSISSPDVLVASQDAVHHDTARLDGRLGAIRSSRGR